MCQVFSFRDHPRSRGEHHLFRCGCPSFYGSSPLARGALASSITAIDMARIIPARAGSTPIYRHELIAEADHPRSRGEHGAPSKVDPAVLGSSPLARGAQVGKDEPHRFRGIIPARAGSTLLCDRGRPVDQDHPRSRGEHRAASRLHRACVGSSPLARGALSDRTIDVLVVGIIPARAGSTPDSPTLQETDSDHPRSRGEHARMNRMLG